MHVEWQRMGKSFSNQHKHPGSWPWIQTTDREVHFLSRKRWCTCSNQRHHSPPERAYLMHYAWRIARENLSPDKVPDMPGVDIQWSHTRPDGDMDTLKSRTAAEQMVQAFDIVFKPALTSKHTEGAAIDMTVTGYPKKSFVNANQQSVELKSHSDLHRLGASFGVHKLVSDPPHWSDDGR